MTEVLLTLWKWSSDKFGKEVMHRGLWKPAVKDLKPVKHAVNGVLVWVWRALLKQHQGKAPGCFAEFGARLIDLQRLIPPPGKSMGVFPLPSFAFQIKPQLILPCSPTVMCVSIITCCFQTAERLAQKQKEQLVDVVADSIAFFTPLCTFPMKALSSPHC